MKPCGTEAAYYRHRYRGEEPCPEDRQAVAVASRQRARAKGVPPKPKAKHGTTSKYVSGCRCVFCRDAQAAYLRAWRAGKPNSTRREPKAWLLRDELYDFLMLEGWATAHEMADRFDRNVQSIERVLRKLRDEGLVKSKLVEMALVGPGGALDSRTEWRTT